MTNFVSAESNTSIASLVLNFNVDYIGRTIANITIYDFLNNFDGNNWGNNGPGVITRALQTFCNTDVVSISNTNSTFDAPCDVFLRCIYDYFSFPIST